MVTLVHTCYVFPSCFAFCNVNNFSVISLFFFVYVPHSAGSATSKPSSQNSNDTVWSKRAKSLVSPQLFQKALKCYTNFNFKTFFTDHLSQQSNSRVYHSISDDDDDLFDDPSILAAVAQVLLVTQMNLSLTERAASR